jgi:hypothetical protein
MSRIEKNYIEIEVELNDLEYDTGYGDCCADLVATVEFQVVTEKIEGAVYQGARIKNPKVLDGTFFCVDQDGGIFDEVPYERGNYDEELISAAEIEFGKNPYKYI